MAAKTLSMSFRVTPQFNALLRAAAARENRSLTNMLETLLFEHCEQHGLTARVSKPAKSRGTKR